MPLKNYSFQIETPKNLQDKYSPHVLVKFEFLAENNEVAEEYRDLLFDQFEKNGPKVTEMIYSKTALKAIDYEKSI